MEDRGNNVINNYKGVMLCSRPNENNNAPIERPFCGRVFNHQQVGLVPIKKEGSPLKQVKKSELTILRKHKQWLQEFKGKQNKVKSQIEQKQKQQQQKFRRIRQLAENDRERARNMKNQYNLTATHVLSVLDNQSPTSNKPAELNPANLRKLDERNEREKQREKQKPVQRQKHTQQLFKKIKNKKRPEWAMTQELKQKKQEQQVDDLLDFFDSNEINQYSEDEQVKSILKNLKEKIKEIKEKEDWRERQAKRAQQRQERRKQKLANNQEQDDDKVTNFSRNSEARSVASEKAQKNIQDLKRKKEEGQEWDKYTATSKHSFSNIDDKIAKNLADEVLRNYPHLKGVHSNTSIRKLLQAQAAKAINEPIMRPVITTIVRDPKPLDTNNLPYLHRNPAI